MSEWSESNLIDYSPNGDDIDRFAQKTKAEFAAIYALLNLLRRGGASAGLSGTDAEAYSTHIDTTTGTIYMRDGENKNWLEMGQVAEHFGLTPEDVGAVKNGGGLGAVYLGIDSGKSGASITPSTYDAYIAYDTCKMYLFWGGSWHVFLSLNFKDMLNVADYVIVRSEVAYSGKDKVLRLDASTGKGNIDITGSPDKLLGKEILAGDEINDGYVLMYSSLADKFILVEKDEITMSDLTKDGTVGKIPVIDTGSKINANITGSPDKLLGKTIYCTNLHHGDVLQYDEYSGFFINKPKDEITNADFTTEGETGKAPLIDEDGKIKADIYGSPDKLLNYPIIADYVDNDQVLAFDAYMGAFIPKSRVEAKRDVGGVDVEVTSIADGQALVYDGAVGKWVNRDISAAVSRIDFDEDGDFMPSM